jgi:hypothetical protein
VCLLVHFLFLYSICIYYLTPKNKIILNYLGYIYPQQRAGNHLVFWLDDPRRGGLKGLGNLNGLTCRQKTVNNSDGVLNRAVDIILPWKAHVPAIKSTTRTTLSIAYIICLYHDILFFISKNLKRSFECTWPKFWPFKSSYFFPKNTNKTSKYVYMVELCFHIGPVKEWKM